MSSMKGVEEELVSFYYLFILLHERNILHNFPLSKLISDNKVIIVFPTYLGLQLHQKNKHLFSVICNGFGRW